MKESCLVNYVLVLTNLQYTEGGRYLNIPKHKRICTACNSGEVEDKEYFLLNCSIYKPLRQVLCSNLTSKIQSPMSKP